MGSETFSSHVFTHNVLLLIIQYNTKDYPRLQCLSKSWKTALQNSIEDYCSKAKLEANFFKRYGSYLSLM